MKRIANYLNRIQENMGDGDIHAEIIKFFQANPNPNDKAVHSFAERIGMNKHKVEGHIYMLLSSVISGGKSPKFKGDYDPKELEMGRKVEMEHTSEPLIADKITKDHLTELKDYYTRLKKMEEGAGVVHELFVKSSEIEVLPKGQPRDAQILRLGVIAEMDASNLYEKLAGLASDKRVAKLMVDVSVEEKVHAGEFEKLLREIDPTWSKAAKEGEDETDKLLGLKKE